MNAATPRRIRVLLVDADAKRLDATRQSLIAAGYDPVAVDSASAATALLATRFDLAIVDLGLPDDAAIGICDVISHRYRTPVILRSATPIADRDRVRGLEAGADAHLIDPVDRDVLVATVATVVGNHRLTDRLDLAVSVTGVGHWEWDIGHGAISWTTSLEAMHGFAPGEFEGTMEAFVATIHPDDRDRVQTALGEALAGRDDSYEIAYEFLRTDGTTGHLAGRARILRGGDGQATELTGVAVDVTASVVEARRNDALVEYAGELMAAVSLTQGCETVRKRGPAAAEADVIDVQWQPLETDLEHLHIDAGDLLGNLQGSETGTLVALGGSGELRHGVVFDVPTASGTGRIALGWREQPHLDDDNLRFLALFAQQSISGLSQLSDHEQQRHIALTLQRALLSAAAPLDGIEIATAYRPAADAALIGGDWFDVVALGSGRAAIVVGDIAGHGVGAAASSAAARHSMRTALTVCTDVVDTLRTVDTVLSEAPDRTTSTALLIVVDIATGEMELVSAGHPPPLLRAGDGTTAFVAVQSGPPLGHGFWADARIPPASAMLASGDVIVAYTDGAVERRTETLDVGFAELATVVAGTSDLHAIVDAVVGLNMVATAPTDDTIALAVRRS